MTRVMPRIAVALQWAGLLGGVAGTAVAIVGYGPLFLAAWAVGGILAVALDVVAIRTRSASTALGAAIGKSAILLVALTVLPIGRMNPAIPALVPLDAGPPLLIASILPSMLGALFRRIDA